MKRSKNRKLSKRKLTLFSGGGLLAFCMLCLLVGGIYNNTPEGKAAATARAQTQTSSVPTITLTATETPIPTSTLTPTITLTLTISPTLPTPTRTIRPTDTRWPTATNGPASKSGTIGGVDHPAGKTGRCKDGSYTEAQHKQGACSHHGGVAEWWGP